MINMAIFFIFNSTKIGPCEVTDTIESFQLLQIPLREMPAELKIELLELIIADKSL